MPVAVLLYHRVSQDSESASADPNRITVGADHFAEQMATLAASCRVLPLAEALADAACLDADPRPTVVLTFDDVYSETLAIVEPLLRRHALPATLFVPTGHVGSPHGYWWDRLRRRDVPTRPGFASMCDRLMRLRSEEAEAAVRVPSGAGAIPPEDRIADWPQLRALDRELFSFGCHGRLHHCFAAVPPHVLLAEIREAVGALADHGLPRVSALAYPYGFDGCVTDEQIATAVAPLFDWGLTTRRGLVDAPRADPHRVPRCYVEDWNVERFEAELQMLFQPPVLALT